MDYYPAISAEETTQTNKQTNKQSNLLTLVKSENNKTEIKNLIKIIMETIILMTLQHN